MASIPLECICCPKKPKFSDVSHLLTHVASKGHLAHYYRLKVRSGSDQSARQTVDAFDQWYSDWRVEDLMHERLNLKDRKKARPRAAVSSRASSRAPPTRTANRANAKTLSIDSRLGLPYIKTETRSTPSLSAANSPSFYHLPQPVSWANASFGWHPSGNFPFLPTQHKIITDWMGDNQSDGSSLTSLPTTESTDSAVGIDDSLNTFDPTEVADCSKLKGILWPGMDIFDSATPEQKRKRNQRKDSSVIERLERDSTFVEATEYVWSPLGSLKKSLAITGNPEEDDEYMLSSPVKPSPRKYNRRRETRSTLTELDGEHSKIPRRTRSSYGQLTAQDEKLDTKLTYGAGQRKKRFAVHEDSDDFAHAEQGSAILNRPTPLSLLTQTFPGPQQFGTDQFAFGSGLRYGGQPFFNKENMTPLLHRSATADPTFCTSTTAFSMAQYSLSQPAPTFNYNETFNAWSNHEASTMFAQPSHSISDHDLLKLSPIKLDRSIADDDDRTITAPPSDI